MICIYTPILAVHPRKGLHVEPRIATTQRSATTTGITLHPPVRVLPDSQIPWKCCMLCFYRPWQDITKLSCNKQSLWKLQSAMGIKQCKTRVPKTVPTKMFEMFPFHCLQSSCEYSRHFKLKRIITTYKDLLYAMWKTQIHGWCDELHDKFLSYKGRSLSCNSTVQYILQTPSVVSIKTGLYRAIPCNNRENLQLPGFPAFWNNPRANQSSSFLPPPGFLLRTFYINTCLVELFLAHCWQEKLSADACNQWMERGASLNLFTC